MKVYLTLFKDEKVQPEGFVGEAVTECSTVNCAEHTDERSIRLNMLCVAMQGLGYEVSFTQAPHSTEDPAPGGVRDEDVVEYEEVS